MLAAPDIKYIRFEYANGYGIHSGAYKGSLASPYKGVLSHMCGNNHRAATARHMHVFFLEAEKIFSYFPLEFFNESFLRGMHEDIFVRVAGAEAPTSTKGEDDLDLPAYQYTMWRGHLDVHTIRMTLSDFMETYGEYFRKFLDNISFDGCW